MNGTSPAMLKLNPLQDKKIEVVRCNHFSFLPARFELLYLIHSFVFLPNQLTYARPIVFTLVLHIFSRIMDRSVG